jgi:hypothetical protein
MIHISNNTVAIISDLFGTIQNFDTSNGIAPKDSTIPAYITELGIRSLILNSMSDGLALSDQYLTTPDSQNISQYKWHRYKNEKVIDDLKTLFTNCDVISFADWSDIYGASDLWDGLLLDIIKPLFKKQFEFVFYLGDPTKRLVQEVDEILDIISGFSLYGQVTLVLDPDEASKLWMVLNGYDPGMSLSTLRLPSPGEKYRSIFNTMNINHLLICGVDRTLSFSKQGQFELVNRSHNNARIAKDGRDIFNAGYCLGLQLQLVISQCVALGLAACGSFMEDGINPDQNALLSYTKRWMAELGSSTKNSVA